MTGKRMMKTAVAAVLALAVVGAVSVRPVPAKATTLSELQQKQAQLQQKSKSLDSQLQQLKNNKAQQQQYKEALDAKITNLEAQISSKNIEIEQLDSDILTKQNQIAAKQKDVDADFQKLKERVYALYLTGEASDLEIILNAKNIMDLADKAELLQVISKHDTDLMNALKDDMNSIAQQKADIEKSRKAASDAKTSMEQNSQQLTALSNQAAQLITTLSQSEKDVAAQEAQSRIDQNAAAAAVAQFLSNYNFSSGGGGSASEVCNVALSYKGTRYVWGGYSPSGFDCSGFVSYVLNRCGWKIGRRDCDGLRALCSGVSSSSARPGDLVFYNYTYGGLPNSHVGIYLGDGKAVQCDDGGVEIVGLSTRYWSSHFAGFGRLR